LRLSKELGLLGLPIKFIGLGEQPDDLQPFDAKQFAQALFGA
jgi:fused signal recognition particle receptor